MKTSGLRCFVAMAVGRDDIDKVYGRVIRPTLRKAGIVPVFMGMLEHNDDIDDRIIREIKQADFVIADLTYARPSVYFEAGFAQRQVPVIYTVRRDHFRPRPDDEPGNLRVHFDLQMRNIIGWRDVQYEQFGRSLMRRIKLVTRPMLRSKDAENRSREEQRRFQNLTLESRLTIVEGICQRYLKRRRFKTIMNNDALFPWSGIKSGQTTEFCMLDVRTSFSIKDIRTCWIEEFKALRSRFDVPDDEDSAYQWQLRSDWRFRVPKQKEMKGTQRITARLILCSLAKITRGRIEAALPAVHGDHSGHQFEGAIEHAVNHKRSIPIRALVHVLDGIDSERDAITKTKSLQL